MKDIKRGQIHHVYNGIIVNSDVDWTFANSPDLPWADRCSGHISLKMISILGTIWTRDRISFKNFPLLLDGFCTKVAKWEGSVVLDSCHNILDEILDKEEYQSEQQLPQRTERTAVQLPWITAIIAMPKILTLFNVLCVVLGVRNILLLKTYKVG